MPNENEAVHKFVVLSSARSGSYMLQSLLDAHPQVECLGEIFNPVYGPGYANWVRRYRIRRVVGRLARDYSVERYLDSLFASAQMKEATTVRGFKVMYPGQFNRCGIFPYYWQEHDFKVVRLTRRNLLRRYVSGKIASIENVWSTKQHRGEQVTINVDVDDLRHHLLRMDTVNKNIDSLAREFQHLFVDYENLVTDHAKEMRLIFRFLGVSEDAANAITAATARQNPSKLPDIIENYDEVYAYLKGGPYEGFVD